jgi:16S rRNA (cytosine967-C5)-methyltransferase
VSRFHSYINSARQIVEAYKGEEPFSSFLKKYYSANKKFGSKDRKQIAHLCYCYFRLGKVTITGIEERLLTALFICSSEPNEMLAALKPEWNEKVHLQVKEKISLLSISFSIQDIFPWSNQLSSGVTIEKFNQSFLSQPSLFIRIRPGYEVKVKEQLNADGIAFEEQSPNCLSFTNTTKLDDVLHLNRQAVIQDYSSQRVGALLQLIPIPSSQPLVIWDCCAASGGKSIMAKDILGNVELTVSDIRESIINNLQKRFQEAGINKYKSFVADLTTGKHNMGANKPDLIIADVPCSGSGTWSRTPEQLYYFEPEKIETYSQLQKKIVTAAIPELKPGGYFLYITCSVFKNENEEVVNYIKEKFSLQEIKTVIIEGYGKKADTMFASLLKKTL